MDKLQFLVLICYKCQNTFVPYSPIPVRVMDNQIADYSNVHRSPAIYHVDAHNKVH